jgi:16S rRNA (uracil1498-N3)-methyltransferase
VGLFIGPEGGFDPAEIALAQRAGIQAVTLGPRILRAETAALVATAIIMSETGEM